MLELIVSVWVSSMTSSLSYCTFSQLVSPCSPVSHSQAYEQKSRQRHSSTVAGLAKAGCANDGAWREQFNMIDKTHWGRPSWPDRLRTATGAETQRDVVDVIQRWEGGWGVSEQVKCVISEISNGVSTFLPRSINVQSTQSYPQSVQK